MRNYEIMFIIRPTLGENEIKEVSKTFENVITSNGGKLTSVKELGQKELAYEIKKFKSGYYFLFNVEATDELAVKEFDRLALISNDVIRHLVTKIED